MKSLLIALVPLFLLAGCETNPIKPEEKIVTKYKYVVTTIPEEMLEVPKPVPNIDTKTSTDKDAALWLVEKEKRTQELEKKLRAVKSYQDRKLKELTVPKEDIIVN